MSKQNWFKMQLDAKNENAISIDIFGEIGWNITAQDFKNELDKYSNYDVINVNINSIGGSVFDGIPIYNLLKANKAHVNTVINGLACSIASVIAMAGNTIKIYDGSYLMKHLPTSCSCGTSTEHTKSAEMLDNITNDIIKIYQTKFSNSADEIKDMLEKETWFSASELKELGIVDEILEGLEIAAKYDFKDYKNTPEQVKALFENKADEVVEDETETEVEAIAETEVEAVAETDDETEINETDEVVETETEQDENLDESETEKVEDETENHHFAEALATENEKGEIVEFYTYGATSTTKAKYDEIQDVNDKTKDEIIKMSVSEYKADLVKAREAIVIEMKLELDSLNLKLDKATESNTKLTEQVSTLSSDKEKLFNDSIEIQARLDQLLCPAMEKENTVQSFKEAIDKAGSYVEARKQYPEVFDAYKKQINNK